MATEAAAETATDRRVNIPLPEAATMVGVHYETLRTMAVEDREWTVVRDGIGRGFRIKLKRDEISAYLDGGLPALRRFRIKKGRK